MKYVSRRPFTLIEMIVALALTVLVLSALTFFYRQITQIDIETERVMADNFQLRYAETRLAKIIPRAVPANNKNSDFVFFSVGNSGLTKPGSQSLIFTFDNDVSLAKEFSNNALARIYLDPNGTLMLAYWPSPKRWHGAHLPPMKKEVLLENVENLTFEFYIAPYREKQKKNDIEKKGSSDEKNKDTPTKKEPPSPEPQGTWSKQLWLVEYQQLPAMVRVIVTLHKRDKPMIFAFPLPNTKTHIIYSL
ncbi:MAG: hypothetical protein WCF65_00345 [Parachlamydiaceae bacterium]